MVQLTVTNLSYLNLDDDRVKCFMKGVFKLRPTKPKYSVTWDPG